MVSELTRFEKVPGDGVQVFILFKSDPSTKVMLTLWRTKDDDPIVLLVLLAQSKRRVYLVHWPGQAQQAPLRRLQRHFLPLEETHEWIKIELDGHREAVGIFCDPNDEMYWT